MSSRGFFGTAQGVLRQAASKRKSVGESCRGFMSDVKEELEVQPHVCRADPIFPSQCLYT